MSNGWVQGRYATTFEWQADWRRQKAAEHPGDERNQQAADGLTELANFIRQLPDDDPVIVALAPFADEGLDHASVGVDASKEISQFRFHDPGQDCYRFLEYLAPVVKDSVTTQAGEAGLLD